jgi:hypothetical protein
VADNTFSDKQKIVRWTGPIPTCDECGAESGMDLLEVTTFGDDGPRFIEMPSRRCPNGPHVEEARRG